jgi:hypothetical protein
MKILKFEELNKEKNMIWLEDPRKYEYVRKTDFTSHNPNCKPLRKDELKCKFRGDKGDVISELKLVGYEKPKLVQKFDVGFSVYQSIYFWLKPYDRGMPHADLCYGASDVSEGYRPSEAVKIV